MEVTLSGVAAILLFLSQIMPRTLLSATRRSEPLDDAVMVRKTFVPLLVGWAFAESIAVLGLVVALSSGSPNKVFPFATLALVGMILLFPSQDRVRSLFR